MVQQLKGKSTDTVCNYHTHMNAYPSIQLTNCKISRSSRFGDGGKLVFGNSVTVKFSSFLVLMFTTFYE